MKVLIAKAVAERLSDALGVAGKREVGGILMAEHQSTEVFRVCDLTVQMSGGTFAAFVRFATQLIAPLRTFFNATTNDFEHFNYIGEWHSHHSFELRPSGTDRQTMREIIRDPTLGANFVLLLLVKQGDTSIEASGTVFTADGAEFPCDIVIEYGLV